MTDTTLGSRSMLKWHFLPQALSPKVKHTRWYCPCLPYTKCLQQSPGKGNMGNYINTIVPFRCFTHNICSVQKLSQSTNNYSTNVSAPSTCRVCATRNHSCVCTCAHLTHVCPCQVMVVFSRAPLGTITNSVVSRSDLCTYPGTIQFCWVNLNFYTYTENCNTKKFTHIPWLKVMTNLAS